MGVSSLPKTVTRQRRGCDLNPGPSAPESSTLTTRLPSHHLFLGPLYKFMTGWLIVWFTGVLDKEVDCGVGDDRVGDLHVHHVRRRRVDDLLARLLRTHRVLF